MSLHLLRPLLNFNASSHLITPPFHLTTPPHQTPYLTTLYYPPIQSCVKIEFIVPSLTGRCFQQSASVCQDWSPLSYIPLPLISSQASTSTSTMAANGTYHVVQSHTPLRSGMYTRIPHSWAETGRGSGESPSTSSRSHTTLIDCITMDT